MAINSYLTAQTSIYNNYDTFSYYQCIILVLLVLHVLYK